MSESPYRNILKPITAWRQRVWCASLAVCIGGAALAEEPPPGSPEIMDYGPVIAESIQAGWPEDNVSMKGLAIRLDNGAGMVFDTDLMRWSVGVRDGWIDVSATTHTRYRDQDIAHTEGREVFATEALPGWAKNGSFDDPREDGRGNLPKDWARYTGYYRHEDTVLLHYTVGEDRVWEMPRAVRVDDEVIFVRTIEMEGSGSEHAVYLFELPDAMRVEVEEAGLIQLAGEEQSLTVGLAQADGVFLSVEDGRAVARVEAGGEGPRRFHVLLGEDFESSEMIQAARKQLQRDEVDFEAIRQGGPARWTETVETEVTLSREDAAYVADRIGLPDDNPWNSWMRLAGIDFFADGTTAAVATWNGDVWIVSGLGENMRETVTWRRFASGLYYPMGLAIVDETIYVTERSQLTRLHDLNGNGEADFYESFNNDSFVHRRAHALGLEVDSEGNFYFFKNGNRVPGHVPDHGVLVRVSPDGTERESYSYGFRGTNTMAIGPGDQILAADQQGNYVPTARVDLVQEGGYHGFPRHRPEGVEPEDYIPPVCWIPHHVDNSSGGMSFVGDPRWGPLAGNWTISSYGQARLKLLMTETVGGQMQGGVVQFPLEFYSGLVRSRVNPNDGQLYLIGLKGWQTLGEEDGSFDRVRYTGKPNYLPVALNVSPTGVFLRFSEALDPEALDLERFEVNRWGYQYTSAYGSPRMSVENPGEEGIDPVEVTGVQLSEEGQRLFLEIPDIKPVMAMEVAYRLRFADGTEEENAVYHTIHRLSDDPLDVPTETVAQREAPTEPGDASDRVSPQEEIPVEEQPEWFARGRQAFETNCTTCHQPTEQAGIAPPMADSEWAAAPAEALVRIVLHGKTGDDGVMMPFGWLDDAEIAEILSYIRVNWHEMGPITADEVNEVRQETEGRSGLWEEEELRQFLD